ncbi:epoxyqueuosine reductase QueH [Dielma fastidiosa]|uniref:epoxyqueuosine reductase QueH n=1 Tax=Dielma fastidiosa TaxID=1034346 RepID=UPI003566FDEC
MKINYYQQSVDELEAIKRDNLHPKLLLHACCAPCSAFPLEFLCPYFDITIYYNNSNIYPENEYARRLQELCQYLNTWREKTGYEVKLIVPPYMGEAYTEKIAVLKDEPEGGSRCVMCYTLRMNEAYAYASEYAFDYFTTVMTISRQKNSQILNDVGRKLSVKYPNVKYFYSDFKKKRGIDRGLELSRENNLYRQDYCGCKFSYEKRHGND